MTAGSTADDNSSARDVTTLSDNIESPEENGFIIVACYFLIILGGTEYLKLHRSYKDPGRYNMHFELIPNYED